MNRKIFLLLFATMTCMSGLFAQAPVAKTDSGRINGATYNILFPANWKGKLVMYAHGYEVAGLLPKFGHSPSFLSLMTPFLERGFAVAASDYSTQGYAFEQGVRDTEALRKYFVKKYGRPDTTFMVGSSMGGAVALATVENFGKNYNGGLPMCPMAGPLYAFISSNIDLYATFNVMFPGIEPPLSQIFSGGKTDTVLNSMNIAKLYPRLNALKKAILAKDSSLVQAYARHLDIKVNDLPYSVLFSELVLRDIYLKAKGNPFDNTNTIYSGFPDSWNVNKKVERIAATVDPMNFFSNFDRTGNINQPVVIMHTVYDQLIHPSTILKFENLVIQQRKLQNLSIKYTNGQGHCAFTPQQIGEAFDELRAWVKTGKKTDPGPIE